MFSNFHVRSDLEDPCPFRFFLSNVAFLRVSSEVIPIRRIYEFRRRRNAVKVPSVIEGRVNGRRVRYLSIFTARSVQVTRAANEASSFKVGSEFIIVRYPVNVSIHACHVTCNFLTSIIAYGVNGRVDCMVFFNCVILFKGGLLHPYRPE